MKYLLSSVERSALDCPIETEYKPFVVRGQKRLKKLMKPTDFSQASKQERKPFKQA